MLDRFGRKWNMMHKGRRRMARFKPIAMCLTHRQNKQELKEFRALLFIID
jgi:hypothetical protein